MKRLIIAAMACLVFFTSMVAVKETKLNRETLNVANVCVKNDNSFKVNSWIDSMYLNMNLSSKGLSHDVFFAACKGYEYMLSQNLLLKHDLITICDFSQSSYKKRLYVLDLNAGKILFNTYVSHGKNSGDEYATSFSNTNESLKSCLGFMRTAEIYIGEHGYSMKLDGLENGFNDNVRSRSIVMHGCDYLNTSRVTSGVMMGRSFGCPAVPSKEVNNIINCIKGGSCFFNYYPDKKYAQASKILNADFTWPVIQNFQLASIKIPDSLPKILATADAFN